MRTRNRTDRPRIIGSIRERLLIHLIADEVVNHLEQLHPELKIDVEALQHVRLGFLREPCTKLWGLCSYADSAKGRPRTEFTERHGTHRILLARKLLHEDMKEAVITIHHEFLHSILGSKEGHGEVFQKHEPRINQYLSSIVRSSSNLFN